MGLGYCTVSRFY